VSPEQLLGELEGEGRFVIGDLEAGIGTVLRLQEGDADLVLVVAQPTAKSIDVAGRAARVATRKGVRVIVIANRVRDEEDLAVIRAGVDGAEIVVVPDDPAVAQADREGLAPADVAPDGPGVRAVVQLAGRLSQAA